MRIVELIPTNLAKHKVKRQGNGTDADLLTIWESTYPGITTYKALCARMGWEPFGGGTMGKQGDRHKPGFCLSGYRDKVLEGRKASPHLFALAIDIVVPCDMQPEVALVADELFARVGMYPDRHFMHLDLVPNCWIRKYHAKRYWVQIDKVYQYPDSIGDAIIIAKGDAQ